MRPSATEAAAKRAFNTPSTYLRNDAGVDVRAAVVRELLGRVTGSVIDLGCGDGRISLQFEEAASVTLADIAPRMLEVARGRVPASLTDRVRTINASLYDVPRDRKYDVVLCIGVLAHLPDLDRAFEVLTGLVEDGGSIVIQFTDFDRPLAHAFHALSRVKHLVSDPSGYDYQQTRESGIEQLAGRHGLEVGAVRSHWALPPFMGRMPVAWCRRFLTFGAQNYAMQRVGSEKLLVLRRRR